MGVSVPALLSVVGVTGAGKTTLIERVVPALVRRGIRVGTVKHDVHGFEMDREGKDTCRHNQAGAHIGRSSRRPARIGVGARCRRRPHRGRVGTVFPGVDLVLTGGYQREALPKLEVIRRSDGAPLRRPGRD